MNRTQRTILVVYTAVVLLLGIAWVPWKRPAKLGVPSSMEAGPYAPIFDRPGPFSTLDTERLGAELVGVTLAAGALVLAAGEDSS